MTNKDRENIVNEALLLIKKEVKDYGSLMLGEKETISYKYIGKICLKRGLFFSDFFDTDGKYLNTLLSKFY